LVEGGFWSTVEIAGVEATAGATLTAALPVTPVESAGSTIEYRVLVLVDGVEMDRAAVASLFIKEETVRDGEALTQQLSSDVFSVTLFVIALASVSFGMYALVLRRRLLAPETEEELADQTDVVVEEMVSGKTVPTLQAPPVPPAPSGQVPPPPPGAKAPPAPQQAPAAPGPDRSSPPPVPPTGLPEGWTQAQWDSYGWKYIDALAKK